MSSEILIRFGWSFVIILAGLGVYRLAVMIPILRARYTRPEVPGARPGIPSILYFTTPECVPCRTVQRPALARIQSALGDQLQVIEVNAYEHPDLADRWGVMSVPTTFILDSSGTLRQVNYGVAREDKLLEQLKNIN